MNENTKKNRLSESLPKFFSVIVGIGAGTSIGIYGISVLDTDAPFPVFLLSLAVILLLLYAAFFLHIIIHEGGHLLFGLLTGYRFSSFRIGSFMILKGTDGFRIRRLSLSGTGGQCLMLPPEWKEGKIPCVLYNLGGCIANAAAAGLFFLLWLFTRGQVFLSAFALFMTVLGLFLALTNGIPMNMGGLDNDGKNALSLRKDPENLWFIWLQLAINGQLSMGVRLKDMPAEWFVIPEEEKLSCILGSTIGTYACNRAMDEMDFEKAGKIASYLLEHAQLAEVHKGGLQAELLFCELIGENRPEEVSRLLDQNLRKFFRSTASYPSTLRLLYTCALFLHHNEEEAKRHLLAFNKAAKTYPYECEIKGEREILNYVYALYLAKKEEMAVSASSEP